MSLSASGDFGLFIASFSSASKDFQHFFARLPRHPRIFDTLLIVRLIIQGFSASFCSLDQSSQDFWHFIAHLLIHPWILAYFIARLPDHPEIPAILSLRWADHPRIFISLLLRRVCCTRPTTFYCYRTLIFIHL